jgi:hypothetical protein
VQNPARTDIGAQVEKMRADIRQYGESRVGCNELHLLCHSEVSPRQELNGIAQIAEWERWTFEYLADGSVRFKSL